MPFLKNKKALIVGVASDRSIAYGIAKAMHREGAALAFTYVNDRMKERVEMIAKDFNSSIVLPCDVTDDTQISTVFSDLKKHWNTLDIIVHSVAFAPRDQFEDDYVDAVNREAFKIAHDVSSYSFVALAKAARSMLSSDAALLTLSYQGSTDVVPNYNIMGVAKASLEANVRYMAYSLGKNGVRVNALSAGAIKTLSASGIKNFRKLLSLTEQVAPLNRNVTIDDVGNVAAFLCSDLAAGITGEVVHVDSGFHCMAGTLGS
ncbi:MAG: enoyl-ACP reductase [Gammaproteobacteria bacterium]|nr:enoyl-ACP reductase [Gammaproteobacteria bacterium]